MVFEHVGTDIKNTTMKNLLLIPALLAFGATSALAQDDDTRLRFGIKGGYNAANLTISDNGETDDKKMLSSFHVGAYVDLPLAPVFSIQPGLMLSGKGTKYTVGDKDSDNWAETKLNPIYLEVPVNAVGKIPLADNFKLFVGAGPYIAMGIAGKQSVEGELLGVSFSEDDNIEYGDDEPINGNNGSGKGNVKRFDYGLNFLGGLEINRFTVNAQYGLGLANINPGSDNDDNDKYKHRVLSFSVGFLF